MTAADATPNPVAIFGLASRRVLEIMSGIRQDQADAATPCTLWNVRQVMNHVIGGAEVLAGSMQGRPPAGDIGGVTPRSSYSDESDLSRLAQAYAGEAERALAAAAPPGALDNPTPGGLMTASQFLIAMATDHIVHGWDLARATGQDDTLDPMVVQTAYAMLTSAEGGGFVAMGRQAGFLGPAVPVPDDASLQDRLIAYMGRQP